MNVAADLHAKLNHFFLQFGLECHPFQVEWYNQLVKEGFHLDFHGDTLAFVVISAPTFFEKRFIPFVRRNDVSINTQDIFDQCIADCLTEAARVIPEQNVSILYDYEMRPGTRRPKVLVQTAGHVSGAVYFYQKSEVKSPPWPAEQAIYGVCLHPKYGGWFALRGVMVFHNVRVPDLSRPATVDILESDEKKIDLLNRYNEQWQSWSFRDIIEPSERYSELQQKYFRAKPGERSSIIEEIKNQSLHAE